MLEILGRRTSSNVMPILWAADEMALDVRQVDIGGDFGGNDTPEYLAKNPNGLVPTLDDSGFVLWESNSILRYLCGQHGLGGLCPADVQERALANQWMDWKLSVVMPMMTPIFLGLVRTAEAERDLGRIERAIVRGHEVWGLLDRHLEGRDYLLGDTLTMADLPLGPQIHRWHVLVESRTPMANVDSWYHRLRERAAFRKHCMGPIV